jgi:NADH-quinone oxidoreductase subunit F
MLGTRALQIFDETTCVVRASLRWTEFYKHESCGKCTPCREGTWWLVQVLAALEKGQGSEADLDLLLDQCDNILGRSFCALADGAVSPITARSSTSATSTSRTSRTAAARSTRPPPPLFAPSGAPHDDHAESREGRRPRSRSPSTASRSASPRTPW